MRIVVIDYGMGNLGSVARALRHVAPDDQVLVSSDPEVARTADRVVFPGQGAMPDCMHYLSESGLSEAVLEAARNKPFLGVCMGEQMLLDQSDEMRAGEKSPTPGLGLIPGRVVRLPAQVSTSPDQAQVRQKVPHMGWNRVFQACEHPIFSSIPEGAYFYFVHSFYAQPDSQSHVAAQTDYGIRFTSALARDNIFATQFHPEKSATIGLRLYENFLRWNP